eukprot:4117001-Amphidinium_carterae.1
MVVAFCARHRVKLDWGAPLLWGLAEPLTCGIVLQEGLGMDLGPDLKRLGERLEKCAEERRLLLQQRERGSKDKVGPSEADK